MDVQTGRQTSPACSSQKNKKGESPLVERFPPILIGQALGQ
ncbi:hypothetical protein [Desulfosarcina widdelii]|nr:hypothetical protein [Desulfosarcina widdelii]